MNHHPLNTRARSVLLALLMAASFGAQADPKLLKKVPPEFPEEASRRNVTDGTLKARLSIDAQGSVTAVDILEAVPAKAKVFNASAVAALGKWKYEGSGKAETVELKLVFSQE